MAWTTIPSTDVDADSPVDEDLMGDLNDNVQYVFDSAIRGGAFATPLRSVYCGGYFTFSGTTSSGGDFDNGPNAIDFDADSQLGAPNFAVGELPLVTFSLAEDKASGQTDWGNFDSVCAYIEYPLHDNEGVSITIKGRGGLNTVAYAGRCYWQAIGGAADGE